MPRRIDVELTSAQADGRWTWRAAGARQPKGELAGDLLPPGAKVGDVVRAEAEFDVEGITVVAVAPPKVDHRVAETIEVVGPPQRDEGGITTALVTKAPGARRDRRDRDGGDRDRRPRRPDGDRGRERKPGEGRERRPGRPTDGPPSADRGARERRPRAPRPERPAPPPAPKAKRLRPGRTHRHEVLASLPEEHKPIAEQVLRGGIPAVRQAVDRQNEQAKDTGAPQIPPDGVVSIAEQLLPALRTAEWWDRAEAALADVDELDLKDLRSVVVAADAGARDETTRELAQQLRDALAKRVESEHKAWVTELAETLAAGRTVRALRLSSRPPKAGAPLPADLSARLAQAAAEALTPETGSERYATVLDAIAFSPVRGVVVAQGVPAEPDEALREAVRKLAGRLPQIAAQFGIEAAPSSPRRGPAKGNRGGKGAARAKPIPAPPPLAPPPETVAEAAPEPAPVAESAPEPERVADSAPEPEPEPLAEPAPTAGAAAATPAAAVAEAAPEPEPVADSAPEPEPESAPEAAPDTEAPTVASGEQPE